MKKRILPKNWLLPNLGDVLFCAVLIGAMQQGNRMMNVDGDLGRHLTIGGYILDNLQIPMIDLFSHTMTGSALVPHEWLSQVLFALSYRLFSFNGVILLSAVILALTFSLLFSRANNKSRLPILSGGLCIIAIGATSFHWLTRPHLFSYLIVLLWINLIEKIRAEKTKKWLLLPLLMLFWANLHGSFVIGFVILGLYSLGLLLEGLANHQRGKQAEPVNWKGLILGGSGALLASLMNPAGWRIWTTSLGYLGNDYLTGHTLEYLPPDLRQPIFWPFMILILLSLWAVIRRRGNIKLEDLLLVLGFAGAAFMSTRAVPFYSLLGVPIIASWLSIPGQEFKSTIKQSKLELMFAQMNSFSTGMLWPILFTTAVLVWTAIVPDVNLQKNGYSFSKQVFPVEAQSWIGEHQPDGNMFNYFPWGGYLLFENWPTRKVFIDGQTDFYGEELTREYETILLANPGWQMLLEKYEVRWVVLPPTELLVPKLLATHEWKTMYSDQTAVILAYDP